MYNLMDYKDRADQILKYFNLNRLQDGKGKTDLDRGNITQADLFEWICIETIYENNYMDLETFSDYHCDGTNDAGIDFILSNNVVGQTKGTGKITYGDVVECFVKMKRTCDALKNENFKNPNGEGNIASDVIDKFKSNYNENDKISICVFFWGASNNFAHDELQKWINDNNNEYYSYNWYDKDKIVNELREQNYNEDAYDNEFEFKIDNNILQNNNKNLKNLEGIIINAPVYEIFRMFEKNGDKLFEQNVRNFINGKSSGTKTGEVNNGIKKTLKEYPDLLWFINNGLVVLADNFDIRLNTIKLTEFSIINGAQTVNNIFIFINELDVSERSLYLNIPIMCKIIKKPKNVNDSDLLLFNRMENFNVDFNQLVIKSTNTQKPIQNWTFFSSELDVLEVQKLVENEGLYLKIKDGILSNDIMTKYKNKILKLPDFTQYAKSILNMTPGRSMQRKNKLFLDDTEYKDTFKLIQEERDNIKIVLKCIEEFDEIKEKFKDKLKFVKRGKQWVVAYLSYKKIEVDVLEKLKVKIKKDKLKYIPTNFKLRWDKKTKVDLNDSIVISEIEKLLDIIENQELSYLYKDDNFLTFINSL
jgi:hypothetical protein